MLRYIASRLPRGRADGYCLATLVILLIANMVPAIPCYAARKTRANNPDIVAFAYRHRWWF